MDSLLPDAGQPLDNIQRREAKAEWDETLEWLSQINFQDKQRAVFDKHHKNTGEWFLASDAFQAWVKGGVNFPLWCPGIRLWQSLT
ncbi:hypothetical protein ONZ43_g1225 [Nemania bipapillata]|uniref:Uncharacterized protein n=1 Tax=Nemania bipapillata TaxID=110536 RepID=A0ACC2J628_9PEZI|nr:hypothetical protein ONZ43_g1225 [Nemania bipapillata]